MGDRLYGCVEAGGTKFVLGVAAAPSDVRKTARLETQTPDETIPAMLAFFRDAEAEHGPLAAFGIASFGPIEADRAAPLWGHILQTPKTAWRGADLAGPIRAAFARPIGFDTDVNAAALAETLWGAAQGANSAAYVTVGTGIGGGAVIGGKPLGGASHPEMGHILPRRHPRDQSFAGVCPFHGDCLEGLASGPAIEARWGADLSALPAGHEAHAIIGYYLAQLATTLVAVLSPEKIIFGGGVLRAPGLLGEIRTHVSALGGAYFRADAACIVAPGLGDRSGLLGALALAQRA